MHYVPQKKAKIIQKSVLNQKNFQNIIGKHFACKRQTLGSHVATGGGHFGCLRGQGIHCNSLGGIALAIPGKYELEKQGV